MKKNIIQLRPYSLAEMGRLYSVCDRTFKKWVEPFAKEIGEKSAGNLINVPWVEPEDVANAVVFLASGKSRFVTGSQFVLDAGLLSK